MQDIQARELPVLPVLSPADERRFFLQENAEQASRRATFLVGTTPKGKWLVGSIKATTEELRSLCTRFAGLPAEDTAIMAKAEELHALMVTLPAIAPVISTPFYTEQLNSALTNIVATLRSPITQPKQKAS